jgi:hypothetical protein
MVFVIRKDHVGSAPAFVVVTPGFEKRADPSAVTYDPDKTRATRFKSWNEAEHWQKVLSVGSDPLTIVGVA